MADKTAKIKEPKQRADQYEEKVKFNGTLEQMIKMAGNTKITKKNEAHKK